MPLKLRILVALFKVPSNAPLLILSWLEIACEKADVKNNSAQNSEKGVFIINGLTGE